MTFTLTELYNLYILWFTHLQFNSLKVCPNQEDISQLQNQCSNKNTIWGGENQWEHRRQLCNKYNQKSLKENVSMAGHIGYEASMHSWGEREQAQREGDGVLGNRGEGAAGPREATSLQGSGQQGWRTPFRLAALSLAALKSLSSILMSWFWTTSHAFSCQLKLLKLRTELWLFAA